MIRFHCPWVTSCLPIQNPSSRTVRTGSSLSSHWPSSSMQPIAKVPPGTYTKTIPVTGSRHSCAAGTPPPSSQHASKTGTNLISTPRRV